MGGTGSSSQLLVRLGCLLLLVLAVGQVDGRVLQHNTTHPPASHTSAELDLLPTATLAVANSTTPLAAPEGPQPVANLSLSMEPTGASVPHDSLDLVKPPTAEQGPLASNNSSTLAGRNNSSAGAEAGAMSAAVADAAAASIEVGADGKLAVNFTTLLSALQAQHRAQVAAAAAGAVHTKPSGQAPSNGTVRAQAAGSADVVGSQVVLEGEHGSGLLCACCVWIGSLRRADRLTTSPLVCDLLLLAQRPACLAPSTTLQQACPAENWPHG